MVSFRFSPIQSQSQLFAAIEYIHVECHLLCKQNLGELLPVAGNIGVFCHFDDEYTWLTNRRVELTDEHDNWNKKYYRLHTPIVIPATRGIPQTTYTYLYIRRPDAHSPHVGDVDFYMELHRYIALKQSLLSGQKLQGVSIFERPDLDLIRLSDPQVDVSSFVGCKTMAQNVIHH